ncbi:DUF58 domain-containing protein [Rossellomorea vietnamensis]|uniref:DUF58 domain-containing protein n=1 Tax=Rossellomorea vietnamensis TaxID=218284 RepID=A0A5D4NUA1_9BACI|nr:DUF58 domain-containing protein [Rossellomorea vietnamensis]TYS17510.1 DUF58 domain-containing protein [Rossellomorea vietnamensis]
MVILLIIGSLSGSIPVVFFSALVLTVSVLSSVYLRAVQNKVTWRYEKYFESTSIDECFDVFIELKNESFFPIFNFTIDIESRNEKELLFIGNDNRTEAENTMYSFSLDLPPKSQKTIKVKMKGTSRGHHQWSSLNLLLTDPLKLQSKRLEYQKEILPVFKVIPKIQKLKDLKLKSLLQGFKNTNHSIFLDETGIVGTKEYENESFRHIHWLATAKENKLLAKKY